MVLVTGAPPLPRVGRRATPNPGCRWPARRHRARRGLALERLPGHLTVRVREARDHARHQDAAAEAAAHAAETKLRAHVQDSRSAIRTTRLPTPRGAALALPPRREHPHDNYQTLGTDGKHRPSHAVHVGPCIGAAYVAGSHVVLPW